MRSSTLYQIRQTSPSQLHENFPSHIAHTPLSFIRLSPLSLSFIPRPKSCTLIGFNVFSHEFQQLPIPSFPLFLTKAPQLVGFLCYVNPFCNIVLMNKKRYTNNEKLLRRSWIKDTWALNSKKIYQLVKGKFVEPFHGSNMKANLLQIDNISINYSNVPGILYLPNMPHLKLKQMNIERPFTPYLAHLSQLIFLNLPSTTYGTYLPKNSKITLPPASMGGILMSLSVCQIVFF